MLPKLNLLRLKTEYHLRPLVQLVMCLLLLSFVRTSLPEHPLVSPSCELEQLSNRCGDKHCAPIKNNLRAYTYRIWGYGKYPVFWRGVFGECETEGQSLCHMTEVWQLWGWGDNVEICIFLVILPTWRSHPCNQCQLLFQHSVRGYFLLPDTFIRQILPWRS